jgi:hypothetical protein
MEIMCMQQRTGHHTGGFRQRLPGLATPYYSYANYQDRR